MVCGRAAEKKGAGKRKNGGREQNLLHPPYVLSLLFNFHLVKILEVIFGDAHAAFHFFL